MGPSGRGIGGGEQPSAGGAADSDRRVNDVGEHGGRGGGVGVAETPCERAAGPGDQRGKGKGRKERERGAHAPRRRRRKWSPAKHDACPSEVLESSSGGW